MKIEKPDWERYLSILGNSVTCNRLDNWFKEHVEPVNKMFEGGVEVYKDTNPSLNQYEEQCEEWRLFDTRYTSHKALLINIQPIKKESPEDVLRDYIKYDQRIDAREGLDDDIRKIFERAKRALGME